MALTKESKYKQSGQPVGQTIDEKAKRHLNWAICDNIQFLCDFPCMGHQWLKMCNNLGDISELYEKTSEMEKKSVKDDTKTLALQTGKKTEGTLWDQDSDEFAIRVFLEEGKLNLALRMLHQYLLKKRSKGFTADVERLCKMYDTSHTLIIKRCAIFEKTVGTLLKYAFFHVEVLQILDIDELLGMCSESLNYIVDNPLVEGQHSDMHSNLVFVYLNSLSKHFESMDEDLVYRYVETHNILNLLVKFVTDQEQFAKMNSVNRVQIFDTLNNFLAGEGYSAQRSRYLCDNLYIQLASLDEKVKDLVSVDSQKKQYDALQTEIRHAIVFKEKKNTKQPKKKGRRAMQGKAWQKNFLSK